MRKSILARRANWNWKVNDWRRNIGRALGLVKGTLQISLKVSSMYFATQNKALIELVCQPNKPYFYRVFAQKEAELVRHMEEEKQGVEEEKMKVAKMKLDLEKERLRRLMGVNVH